MGMQRQTAPMRVKTAATITLSLETWAYLAQIGAIHKASNMSHAITYLVNKDRKLTMDNEIKEDLR